MAGLIAPHGGALRHLLTDEAEARELRTACKDLPSWDLTAGQLCDVEQILTGAYSPLDGFLGERDYTSVLESGHLAENGVVWSWPVVLDVGTDFAHQLEAGSRIALRDAEGSPVAILGVSDNWQADRDRETQRLFEEPRHRAARAWSAQRNPIYVGGQLTGIDTGGHPLGKPVVNDSGERPEKLPVLVGPRLFEMLQDLVQFAGFFFCADAQHVGLMSPGPKRNAIY